MVRLEIKLNSHITFYNTAEKYGRKEHPIYIYHGLEQTPSTCSHSNKIETSTNTALRAILKDPLLTSETILHSKTNTQPISVRLKPLDILTKPSHPSTH